MNEGLLTLMLQSVAGLAFVLALFGLLVWMLKSLQNKRYLGGSGTSMRVIKRCSIDAKHSVVELAYGHRTYLIGLSPTGMTAIDNQLTVTEKTSSREEEA
ncbi:MAG: flagellar biosynthetic protein FliO [Mariprofundaceae bacterium]